MPEQDSLNGAASGEGLWLDALKGRMQSLGTAARMKTWDEMTDAEKMERLRDCLRSKDMAIRELREQVSMLLGHLHGPNGELLTRLYGGLSSGVGYSGYDPLA